MVVTIPLGLVRHYIYIIKKIMNEWLLHIDKIKF